MKSIIIGFFQFETSYFKINIQAKTMPLEFQPDLMSMFQQDQESVLNGIQKFVNDIFSGNDKEAKLKLCEKLHEIAKNCHCSSKIMIKPKTRTTRKRSKIFENVTSESQIVKTAKLECKKLPNELWLKIMNYLNTKDLINNVSLVCKNFNSLTKEVKYLELKNITELDFESVMNFLKITRHLKEISVTTKSKNTKLMNQLLNQALKSSKCIQSIKLLPTRYLGDSIWSNHKLHGFKKITNYCRELEHLHIRDVVLDSSKVISQIAQNTMLKSLKISMTSYGMDGKFTPENVLEFANNCQNLEDIKIYINIDSTNITQANHAFDVFFNSKKQTLKSFSINRAVAKSEDWDLDGSCVLEKLDLCQHLEELSLKYLNIEKLTLESIINLPKLKTLVVRCKTLKTTEFTISSQVPISMNLKHLNLSYRYEEVGDLLPFMLGFAKIKYPFLERFSVQIHNPFNRKIGGEAEMFTKSLNQMIAKSPNLKSIQLYGQFFLSETCKDVALQLCERRNIIITFGRISRDRYRDSEIKKHEKFQNDFESYMEHKDMMSKTKYDDLKRNFLDWEKRNNWWTWAMEDY